MSGLRVNVSDLMHHSGARRAVHLTAPMQGLEVIGSRVPARDPLTVDLTLERINEGILVMGDVEGHWVAECSRCLVDLDVPFAVEVRELFERDPLDEETYAIEGDEVDLEPVVRDAVLVELPLAPVCDAACRGLCPVCGADRNRDDCGHRPESSDPRWAALGALEFHDNPN